MNIDCEIIRDLLPLYADGVCSDRSRTLVEEHLSGCTACRELYEKMTDKTGLAPTKPDGERVFRRLMLQLTAAAAALAAIICCAVINLAGALDGGRASAVSFAATIGYILFFGAFTFLTRRWRPFVRFSLIFSLLTSASSIFCLICRLTDSGGFLSLIPGAISAVSFYGFRYFLDWTPTYALASVISLIWLGYALLCRRKLRIMTGG